MDDRPTKTLGSETTDKRVLSYNEGAKVSEIIKGQCSEPLEYDLIFLWGPVDSRGHNCKMHRQRCAQG